MFKLILGSKTTTVGIDFSNGWVKLAEAEGDFVTNLFAVELPSGEKSRLLKTKPDNIISSMPRGSVTVRFLKLPSADEAEVEKMLKIEVVKQLPFLNEDAVFGFKILETDKDGYSRVMFAVAEKNVLIEHLNRLKSLALSPSMVCLSSEAALNCFLQAGNYTKAIKAGLYMLLNIDYIFTELWICQDSNILFNRAFAQGANFFKDKAGDVSERIESFLHEIRRSLMVFGRNKTAPDKQIKGIFVLSGTFESLGQIKQALSAEFTMPVECPDILRDLKNSKKIQQDANIDAIPVSFASVIGAVLGGLDLKINIMPLDMRRQYQSKQNKSELLRFYGLFFLIIICIGILIGTRGYYKKAYLGYLNRQIARLDPYVKKARVEVEKLEMIKQRLSKDRSPLEIIKCIYEIIPQDADLSVFSLKNDGSLMLRGTSCAMPAVFNIVSKMDSLKNFKSVKLVFANKRKTQSGEAVDFQINCFLK